MSHKGRPDGVCIGHSCESLLLMPLPDTPSSPYPPPLVGMLWWTYWSAILVTTVTTERNGGSVIGLQTRSRGVLSAPPVCLPSLWFESDTNHFHFNMIALWGKIPWLQNSDSVIEVVFWYYSFRFLILWIVYLLRFITLHIPALRDAGISVLTSFFLSDTSGAGPWWRHCVIVAPWPQIVLKWLRGWRVKRGCVCSAGWNILFSSDSAGPVVGDSMCRINI